MLSGDLAEFRNLSDQNRAGNWANPGNRTQDVSGLAKALIFGDDLFNLGFKLRNLAIQQAFQLGVHGFKYIGRSQLTMRLDLRQQPFSCFDELPTPCVRKVVRCSIFL